MGSVSPQREPSTGWWITAALAGVVTALAWHVHARDARPAAALLSLVTVLSVAEALHRRRDATLHTVTIVVLTGLVLGAAALALTIH